MLLVCLRSDFRKLIRHLSEYECAEVFGELSGVTSRTRQQYFVASDQSFSQATWLHLAEHHLLAPAYTVPTTNAGTVLVVLVCPEPTFRSYVSCGDNSPMTQVTQQPHQLLLSQMLERVRDRFWKQIVPKPLHFLTISLLFS